MTYNFGKDDTWYGPRAIDLADVSHRDFDPPTEMSGYIPEPLGDEMYEREGALIW